MLINLPRRIGLIPHRPLLQFTHRICNHSFAQLCVLRTQYISLYLTQRCNFYIQFPVCVSNYDEKWGKTIPKTHKIRIIIVFSFHLLIFARELLTSSKFSEQYIFMLCVFVCLHLSAVHSHACNMIICVAVKSHTRIFNAPSFSLSLVATEMKTFLPH